MNLETNDLAEARVLFAGAGVPFPYVPPEMQSAFRQRSRWCYATREVQDSPYDIHRYVTDARSDAPDYVLLAHAGRGVNSYAIHYFLVRGLLGLFVQAPWGGVYMDAEAAAARMREYFDLAEALAKAGTEAPSPPPASDRLVVVVPTSTAAGGPSPGVPFPRRERVPREGRDVLQAALEWVRSQR
jgi:hypothetical protein